MPKKIFISYSRQDEVFVKRLVKALKKAQLEYFFDRKDVDWGDHVIQKIQNGLSECEAIVVVISPSSLKSQWVTFEIGYAKGMGKKVLPLLTNISLDIPGFIRDLHYKTSIEEAVKNLTTLLSTNSNATKHISQYGESDSIEYKRNIGKKGSIESIEKYVAKQLSRIAEVEDIDGNKWKIKNLKWNYKKVTIEPGFDRFQSQKLSNKDSPGKRFFIYFGDVEVFIPVDALFSIKNLGEHTFSVEYLWNMKRISITGLLDVENEIEGITELNQKITISIANLKQLFLPHDSPPILENQPHIFSNTIILRNRKSFPFTGIKRVSHHSSYCYHYETFIYSRGSNNLEVEFRKLKCIELPDIPNTVHLKFKNGVSIDCFLAKNEIFKKNFIGFNGFTDFGEFFVNVNKIKTVWFGSDQIK